MTRPPSFDEFVAVAREYRPFPWEAQDDEFQADDVKGKNAVLVSLVRFWKVIAALTESAPEFRSIIDVGPYPGSMSKLLRRFFDQDFQYQAVGLGFSEEYRNAMAELGGSCFETELDPEFVEPSKTREWPVRDADGVLLLDVIEHMTNPVHCLDAINRSLRPGGVLIVTTDNLTSFANTYQMLRRGKSPNIHPLRSSLFFRGNWRPHFREFAADELRFFLEFCGFSVIRHEYFERKQGDFSQDADGRIRERGRYRGIKGSVQRAMLALAPHLRDHQLVVARKATDFDAVVRERPAPTRSFADWLRMCARAGV